MEEEQLEILELEKSSTWNKNWTDGGRSGPNTVE